MDRQYEKFNNSFEDYKSWVMENKRSIKVDEAKTRYDSDLCSWRRGILRNGLKEWKTAIKEFDETYTDKYTTQEEKNKKFRIHMKAIATKQGTPEHFPNSLDEYLSEANFMDYSIGIYIAVRKTCNDPSISDYHIPSMKLLLAIIGLKSAINMNMSTFVNSYRMEELPTIFINDIFPTLTIRERWVLQLRFGFIDGSTRSLEETVNILSKLDIDFDSKSPERIRQIEAKALRKMRHPSRSVKFRPEYNPTTDRNTSQYIKEAKSHGSVDPSDIKLIKVESLDFSVRTFNCLRRAGIINIGDLLMRNPNELIQIRNLGRKSAYEIIEKMNYLGFTDWTAIISK